MHLFKCLCLTLLETQRRAVSTSRCSHRRWWCVTVWAGVCSRYRTALCEWCSEKLILPEQYHWSHCGPAGYCVIKIFLSTFFAFVSVNTLKWHSWFNIIVQWAFSVFYTLFVRCTFYNPFKVPYIWLRIMLKIICVTDDSLVYTVTFWMKIWTKTRLLIEIFTICPLFQLNGAIKVIL